MYISPSNIIETGYTNGTQFVVTSTQTIYTGYFHKDNFGKYWTGKEHTELSKQLTDLLPSNPVTDQPISVYRILKPDNIPPVSLKSDFISPTEEDYNKGYFARYILRDNKSIQPKFIELTQSIFQDTLSISNINILYNGVTLDWKLTGPLYDVYKNNIRVNSGIIDTNKRSIQEAERFLPDLSLYLTDPLQFGKPS